MPIALYALALAAFAVGTAEFIIAGLLPTLAADLQVTIPDAGLLVTGYALGVAVGGPVLALATAHLPRRPMILVMVALYAVGQAACALAPNYGVLLAARVLVALTHGLFFGNATIAAAQVVPFERRGAAISIVLAGVPLANLLGVPIGAAIGHWLGWRASFWGVAGLGAIALAAIAATLPAVREEAQAPVPWRDQVRVLFRHQVGLSYLTLFVLLIGVLAFNTFQVPFLIEMTGVPEASTPPYLFAYGAGAVIGIFAGGRLADWKLMPAMLGSTFAYVAVSAAILRLMHSPVAMFVLMVVLGAAVYTFTVPPQTRIVHNAAGAPTLAATFIATAFNLGYALGALVGAALLANNFGYPSLPVVGIVTGLGAAAITLLSWRLDRRP
jgi:DHA1 family inner membrane transport protein